MNRKTLATVVALSLGVSGCDDFKDSSSSTAIGARAHVKVPEACSVLLDAHVEMADEFYDELRCRNEEGKIVVYIKVIGDDEWTERIYEGYRGSEAQ